MAFSVTRWQDNIFQYFAVLNYEKLHNSIKLAKVGSQFCKGLNKVFKNCQRLNFCCRCGEITPKLIAVYLTSFSHA